MGGIHRSAAERARLLAQYQASGVSKKAFAERLGIPLSTFYQWRATDTLSAQPVRFARLVRSAERSAKNTASVPTSSSLVIELGNARIRIESGFDRDLLVAVMDVLEPRCRRHPS